MTVVMIQYNQIALNQVKKQSSPTKAILHEKTEWIY